MNIVERLRDMSEWLRSNGYNMSALQSTEAADEIERLKVNRDDWMAACNNAQKHRNIANDLVAGLESEIERLRSERDALRAELNKAESEIQRLQAALDTSRKLAQRRCADNLALRVDLVTAEVERDALRAAIDASDDMRLRLLDAALTERDALRADALRYRWLRDEKNEGGFAVFQIDDSGATIRNKIFLGAELDAAIDGEVQQHCNTTMEESK